MKPSDIPPRSDACPSRHCLDRRRSTEPTDYSPAWETKTAISSILDITLKPIGFRQQLREILDVLTSISWLRTAHKGAIFVANEDKELILIAEHELNDVLRERCARVPFGHCLCGRAAKEKEIIFKTCVDEEHDIRFDGMAPHGHYNVPLLAQDGEVVGVLVLYLPHGHEPHPEEADLMRMLGNTLSNILVHRNLKLRAEIGNLRLQKAQMEMMQKLLAASEFRDNETGQHIKRMTQYAVILGRGIGLDEEELKLLELAAPMHDVGKVGIPDSILLKPGPLTDEELETMRRHPAIGAEILSGDHPLIKACREVSLTHHEKWDGSGYPQGLAGEAIPLFGRICALADVFDALSSERPYKQAWPLEETLELIRRESGRHFDPILVETLFTSLPEILAVRSIYSHGADVSLDVDELPDEKRIADAIVNWNASLSIDIDGIDRQHHYLINLINRIHRAVEETDATEVVEILIDMQQYSRVHFAEEEALMKEYDYPGSELHIELHRRFIDKTEDFIEHLETTPLAISAGISLYLKDWLVSHIQTADAELGDYIARANGQAGDVSQAV